MKALKKITGVLGLVLFLGTCSFAQKFTYLTIENPIETKFDFPHLYKRSSVTRYYIEVKKPKKISDAIKKSIEKCAKEAVAAGVLSGVSTGNPGVGVSAMKVYLKACLTKEVYNLISVKSGNKKRNGRWRRA